MDADRSERRGADAAPRGWRWPWRSVVLLGLLVPFTGLTGLAVRSGAPADVADRPVLLTMLATVTGPFVGPIARHGQACCLRAALAIAAVSGPVLALGLIAQVVPLPVGRWRSAVRLGLWALGWFAWLAGGPVSFTHALF